MLTHDELTMQDALTAARQALRRWDGALGDSTAARLGAPWSTAPWIAPPQAPGLTRPPGAPRTDWHALQDALMDCDSRTDGKRLDTQRLGRRLRAWDRRMVHGLRLVACGTDRTQVTVWLVPNTLSRPLDRLGVRGSAGLSPSQAPQKRPHPPGETGDRGCGGCTGSRGQ